MFLGWVKICGVCGYAFLIFERKSQVKIVPGYPI